MKIGNIEVVRDEHGQIIVRKYGVPRRWPELTSNTMTIEPAELVDLRVLLDALEERAPPEPMVASREITAIIREGAHELARNVYARSMRRAVVLVEVHPETFRYVQQHSDLAYRGDRYDRKRIVLDEDVVVICTESRTGDPLAQLPHNVPQTDDIVYRAVVEGALALRQDIANRTGDAPLIDVEVPGPLFERLGGGRAAQRGGGRYFNPCVGVEISLMMNPYGGRNGGRGMGGW